jgi:hypothetical protein
MIIIVIFNSSIFYLFKNKKGREWEMWVRKQKVCY